MQALATLYVFQDHNKSYDSPKQTKNVSNAILSQERDWR